MTAVESLTVTELDEQTRDELQPPCSWKRIDVITLVRHDFCSRPALWVIRIRCSKCGRGSTTLACDQHLAGYLAETAFCSEGCKTIAGFVESVERL